MKRQHAHIHSLLHSVAILEKRLESLLVPSGIRHRQALVLDALRQIGPSSQQHLAKHFSVSPGTMSSMISRLETLAYIKRETSPTDRRTDVISITSDGVTAIADVADVWQEGDKIVANLLGAQKSKQLFTLADELSKALGGGPPKTETPD
ncbi:MAG: MarR family winged helix-turn-helix transcriptional regulator [Hyphomicrobiales bacterium]